MFNEWSQEKVNDRAAEADEIVVDFWKEGGEGACGNEIHKNEK